MSAASPTPTPTPDARRTYWTRRLADAERKRQDFEDYKAAAAQAAPHLYTSYALKADIARWWAEDAREALARMDQRTDPKED